MRRDEHPIIGKRLTLRAFYKTVRLSIYNDSANGILAKEGKNARHRSFRNWSLLTLSDAIEFSYRLARGALAFSE